MVSAVGSFAMLGHLASGCQDLPARSTVGLTHNLDGYGSPATRDNRLGHEA